MRIRVLREKERIRPLGDGGNAGRAKPVPAAYNPTSKTGLWSVGGYLADVGDVVTFF
jgi:hypothetical protein